MTKAIYIRLVAITFAILAVYTAVFIYFYTEYNIESTKDDMISAVNIIEKSVSYDDNIQNRISEYKDAFNIENMRITVIDRNGNVIADSDSSISDMENHISRREVQEALKDGKGTDIRKSETLGIKMLYIAVLSSNGNFIYRISIPYTNRLIYIKAIIPACIITVLVTLVFALIFGKTMVNNITEPLTELTNEIIKINVRSAVNLKEYRYEELNCIAKAVNVLSERVEKGLRDITDINRRTEYILDNMNDGFVIIDSEQNVLGINKAAMEILECGRRKKLSNIVHYTRNTDILDAVEAAADKGQNSLFDIKLEDGRVISVHISAIGKGVIDDKGGVIMLLVDVTAERESYEIRQNFFSNASHELKTPITSIKGYSELLNSDMEFSDHQKKEFIERISKESDNLTSLINDILTISRIESGESKKDNESINLRTETEEILKSLNPEIYDKKLIVDIICDDVTVEAERNKITALISNLISNAVKYNTEKGKVSIDISYKDNKLYIEVADTGIGIPKHEQQRVFERFYRVDKGRSKKTAGTGLGLSIVKHIVAYYNGTIEIESDINKGTLIKVMLNLEQTA